MKLLTPMCRCQRIQSMHSVVIWMDPTIMSNWLMWVIWVCWCVEHTKWIIINIDHFPLGYSGSAYGGIDVRQLHRTNRMHWSLPSGRANDESFWRCFLIRAMHGAGVSILQPCRWPAHNVCAIRMEHDRIFESMLRQIPSAAQHPAGFNQFWRRSSQVCTRHHLHSNAILSIPVVLMNPISLF